MTLHLPTQAVVDRSVLLEMFLVETPIRDTRGTLIQILKNTTTGGPFGPLPGDPGRVPAGASVRGTLR